VIDLMMDKGLQGESLPFPITLKAVDGLSSIKVTYNNLDDLIKAISVEQVKLLNKDKKLSQIIDELGLYDTRTLMDTRTENIITNFMYYRSNATPIAPFDNKVWFDSVLILESKVNQRVL